MNRQQIKMLTFIERYGTSDPVSPIRKIVSVQKNTLFTKKKKGFGKRQSRAKVFYVQSNSFENLEFIGRE